MRGETVMGPDFSSKVLARGRMAEIRALDHRQVLKVFRPGVSLASAETEARKTQALHEMGLPVPRVWEVIQVEGRPALVMDRVNGVTMLEEIARHPFRIAEMGRLCALLHARIHAHSAPRWFQGAVHYLRDRIQRVSRVDESLRLRAMDLSGRCSGDHALCHGDFHPGNIMIGKEGPVVIDWDNGVKGPPAFDVARTIVLVRAAMCHIRAGMPRALISAASRVFLWQYLKVYRRVTGLSQEEITSWEIPVTLARLGEGIAPEEGFLRGILPKASELPPRGRDPDKL